MMQLTNRLLMSAMLVLMLGATAGAADQIRIRERAVMATSVVYLADVAEIVTADAEREKQLGKLPLMPAPAPGTQRFLQRREIADLLAAHGVDLRGVRFEGADQVEIACEGNGWTRTETATVAAPAAPRNRHAAVLAGQVGQPSASSASTLEAGRTNELRDQLNRLIVSYLNTKVSQAATWNVSCDVTDRHLAPLGTATSTLVCQGGNPPWTGRQRFVVSFRTPEGPVQVPVYAEVEATSTPVVVAVQPIGRGEPITAAAIELRSVDYLPKANGRGAAIESIEELIGMEAGQAIRAGEVVFTGQVQAPLLVQRGDLISIASQAGGISVRTTARAREDGTRGDLVQVESLDTRERFDARVVGPRAAAIFAPARVETAQRATVRK